MTILERLQRLESQAELALNDGSIKQDIDKIDKHMGRVSAVTAQVGQVVTAYEELRSVRPDECQTVRDDLIAVRSVMAEMAMQTRASPLFGATTDFAVSLANQERAIRMVDNELQSIWRSYREGQHKSFVDREFLEILGRSGLSVDSLLDRFDSASRVWDILEIKSLPHQGDVVRIQEAISSFSTVAEGLTEIVPPAIAVFLRQADSDEGAPLAALNKEVLRFLEEHDLIDRYAIRGQR